MTVRKMCIYCCKEGAEKRKTTEKINKKGKIERRRKPPCENEDGEEEDERAHEPCKSLNGLSKEYSQKSLTLKKYRTDIEKIMLRIQPPIQDRERYTNPRHVYCFLEKSKFEEDIPKKRPYPFHPCKSLPCTSSVKKRNSKKVDEKEREERERDQDETEVENDKAEKNKTKRELNSKPPLVHDTEDDECVISICSNDSRVCLAGISMTEEDKRVIEENREKHHPTSAKKKDKNIKEINNKKIENGEEKEAEENKEINEQVSEETEANQ